MRACLPTTNYRLVFDVAFCGGLEGELATDYELVQMRWEGVKRGEFEFSVGGGFVFSWRLLDGMGVMNVFV